MLAGRHLQNMPQMTCKGKFLGVELIMQEPGRVSNSKNWTASPDNNNGFTDSITEALQPFRSFSGCLWKYVFVFKIGMIKRDFRVPLLRASPLCDIMQQRLVVSYRCFLTTYWSHLHGSSNPRRTSWTAWPLKMGLTRCSETLVTSYQSMLHNILEVQGPLKWLILWHFRC
jgi:hypothetical protein